MTQPRNIKQIHLSELVSSFVFYGCMIAFVSQGRDTLKPGEILTDWNADELESSGGKFRLTFFGASFSPYGYNYLGIQTMDIYQGTGFIWVANRDNPLVDHSGFLNLTSDGILMINSTRGPPFVLNPGQKGVSSTSNLSLTLLDTGNLVLRAGQEVIWQSFDFPVDTWLPGVKIGLFDLKSAEPQARSLISWLSPFAPDSFGAFTLGLDPNRTNQLVIWQRGRVHWQSGAWDGEHFSTFSDAKFTYVSNENESYFTLSLDKEHANAWVTLNSSGGMDMQFEYADLGWSFRSYSCDTNNSDWSTGCTNRTFSPSNCSLGDEFVQTANFSGVFDYANSSIRIGINDCRDICMKNCSCIAYTSQYSDGRGCMFSTGTQLSGSTSKNAYIRQKQEVTSEGKKNRFPWVFVVVPVGSLILIIAVMSFCYWRRRIFENNNAQDNREQDTGALVYELNAAFEDIHNTNQTKSKSRVKKDNELPLFSFSVIQCATANFSTEKKLGQGGFGPVYKGKLENGQEIAVKRLSQNSVQGVEEFKNEVILISKLQHRNLVRLLGCCIKGEEKLLIYEYMPNKSLDSFIFDATKRGLLDWGKRFCIMEGIAQGLLYLHKYSRLRIIHRDLKTSNILLDSDLNPKISDFGTARIFGDNESRANTIRIVGTYGYMSPEYAMEGLFSVKSDVFSYGVMMLEIISGRKNTSFHHCNRFMNLLGHAWDLWKEGRSSELMDPELEETSSMTNESIRCIQIALLCVQENAVDRPNMSDVLSMLTHETITLPTPKQPAFFLTESGKEENSIEEPVPSSVTRVSITDVTGR